MLKNKVKYEILREIYKTEIKKAFIIFKCIIIQKISII